MEWWRAFHSYCMHCGGFKMICIYIYIYAPFVKGKHLFSCLFVCFVAKIQRQRDLQWWIRSEKLSNTHCLFCFDGKLAFQELLEKEAPKVLAPSPAYSWSCMAGPTLGDMWMAIICWKLDPVNKHIKQLHRNPKSDSVLIS